MNGRLIVKIAHESASRLSNRVSEPIPSNGASAANPAGAGAFATLPKSPSSRTIHSTISSKVFTVVKVDGDEQQSSEEKASENGAEKKRASTSSFSSLIQNKSEDKNNTNEMAGTFLMKPEDSTTMATKSSASITIVQSTGDVKLVNGGGAELKPVIQVEQWHDSESLTSTKKPVFGLTDAELASAAEAASVASENKKSSSTDSEGRKSFSNTPLLGPQMSLPADMISPLQPPKLVGDSRQSSFESSYDDKSPRVSITDVDHNSSSGSGDMQGVKKSFQSLKVPIFPRAHDKVKKKHSFQGNILNCCKESSF